MNQTTTISKREFRNMFINPVGYIFAGLLIIITNWIFFTDFFVNGQVEMRGFWGILIFLFSLFIPAITMNVIAEEKKNGNWEILLSTPVDEKNIILGKFFGILKYLVIIFLLTVPTIATVLLLGKADIGLIIAGLIGSFILAASYVSVGIFMSSITNQPIVAFLGSTVILMLNNLMGQEVLLSRAPVAVRGILEMLSLKYRSAKFGGGLFEIGDMVFFASWIALFLIFSMLSLKIREK